MLWQRAKYFLKQTCFRQKVFSRGIRDLLKAVEVEGGIVAAQSNWQQGKPTPLHFAKQRLSVRFTNAQVLRLLRRLVQSRQHLVVIPAAWRMGAIEHPFPSFANQRSATP